MLLTLSVYNGEITIVFTCDIAKIQVIPGWGTSASSDDAVLMMLAIMIENSLALLNVKDFINLNEIKTYNDLNFI